MKNPTIIACTVFAIALLISCKKSQKIVPDNTPGTVMGRWSIAVDSIGTTFPGVFVYKGVSTDYYDFRADGKLYINEGPYGYDTVAFNVLSDSTIELKKIYSYGLSDWMGYHNPWNIRTLTNHKLIISAWHVQQPAPLNCACTTQEVTVLSK